MRNDTGRTPLWRLLLAGTNGLLLGLVPFSIALDMLVESVHEVPQDSWTDWGAGVLLVLILSLLTFGSAERNVGLPPRGARGPVQRGWLVGGALGVLAACAVWWGNDWLHPRLTGWDDGLLALVALALVTAWGLTLVGLARPEPRRPAAPRPAAVPLAKPAEPTKPTAPTKLAEATEATASTKCPTQPAPSGSTTRPVSPRPSSRPPRRPSPRRQFWGTAALAVLAPVAYPLFARYSQDGAGVPAWLALPVFLAAFPVALATVLMLLVRTSVVSARRKLALLGGWAVLGPTSWLLSGALAVGDPIRPVWAVETAPGPADGAGVTAGAWALEGTLVRLTSGELTAHAVTDGATRWAWRPPDGRRFCAAAEHPAPGVLLLALRAPDAARCDTAVALDPADGQPLWSAGFAGGDSFRTDTTAAAPAPGDEAPPTGQLALAGPAAVLSEPAAGFRGLTTADGTELWTAEAADGCAPVGVAGEGDRLATVEFCVEDPEIGRHVVVSRRDPADGTELSRHPLPHGSLPGDLDVVSVEPLLVHSAATLYRVPETAERPVELAVETQGLTLRHQLAPGAFSAVPLRGTTVVDDLLVVRHWQDSDRYPVRTRHGERWHTRARLAGYSLRDGTEVWRSADFDGEVVGLTRQDGRITVLNQRTAPTDRTELSSFDPRTGERVWRGRLHPTQERMEAQLLAALPPDDGWLLLHQGTPSAERPVLQRVR
ncbi:PQQ-binding-like beta-propeller repeat protein [Streptomyces sp. DSM 44915]|uniref:PQQ-binding-like beta-propeller repeat protein n=1 Tax=Streptomyces chisholmiae TaxID=3075540 RepID=A0ABU2JSA6_9ACTN|nr:PQQ-binding-like beta-propeller repeat protein [Streptomyces sp. DSM 44915]MDT0267609.1 PQQ-binding-like beta-propeller repeat protein [Streptomyces sp. DSM 44915]